MSNKSDGLWQINLNPKEEQDKLFKLIEFAYKSKLNSSKLEILQRYSPVNSFEFIPNDVEIFYDVKILSNIDNKSHSLKFTTSNKNGVWGIDITPKILPLDTIQIIELVQSEIRDSKINDILDE